MTHEDLREERLLATLLEQAAPGDPEAAIRVIDRFGWEDTFLMNVGDGKGEILDAAVRRAGARRILELGAYCGYSALRMAVVAPEATITSIELDPEHVELARQVHGHAGVGDRIAVVHGSLGDGGEIVDRLERAHGFGPGCLDLVFIDHAKDAYLPDLQTILGRGWLRQGGLAVADNIGYPGAPGYRAAMEADEGRRWRTEVHETKLEYTPDRDDIVLVSEFLRA